MYNILFVKLRPHYSRTYTYLARLMRCGTAIQVGKSTYMYLAQSELVGAGPIIGPEGAHVLDSVYSHEMSVKR